MKLSKLCSLSVKFCHFHCCKVKRRMFNRVSKSFKKNLRVLQKIYFYSIFEKKMKKNLLAYHIFYKLSTILIPMMLIVLLMPIDKLSATFGIYFSTNPILYLDKDAPVNLRVNDLIKRMTVEEKVGQMMQVSGGVFTFNDAIMNQKIGSFLALSPSEAKKAIEINKKTRLKIPLLIGCDAIHGHSFFHTATIFPTQLGMACSFDYDLIKRIGAATASEMRYTGPSLTFAPLACIARDIRWGRVGETFGEDPYLIGYLCAAMIKGLQGDELSNNQEKVAATIKHFAGYSQTVGGLDASDQEYSQRTLESWFFPPFKKAVEAGVATVMCAYQSVLGVPAVANSWLLRTKLKEEWGFDGFVISDWNCVGSLISLQKVAKDINEAAEMQTKGGNDMVMSTPTFISGAMHGIKKKNIPLSLIDDAVQRILSVKFKLGLFEDPRIPDEEKAAKRNCSPEHVNLALEAALKSLVLLENNGILPLSKEEYTFNGTKKIGLLGPNAKRLERQLGDWSLGFARTSYKEYPKEIQVSVKQALEKRLGSSLVYETGCSIENGDYGSVEDAITAVKDTDLIIVTVGDSPQFVGEGRSTAKNELMGNQIELLENVAALGKPFIIDIISSKPLLLPKCAFRASAIIQQFSPGMQGGAAFDKIIFGEEEPRGKLPISIPRHSGQNPCYYQRGRGIHGYNYADLKNTPRYPFGYGLTYTQFSLSDASLDKKRYRKDDTIVISVTVKNVGTRKGTQVVQCYISDDVTSVIWVDKELKGFAIVELEPNEEKIVKIKIDAKECSIVNGDAKRVVENGMFTAHVGTSSKDANIKLPFEITDHWRMF